MFKHKNVEKPVWEREAEFQLIYDHYMDAEEYWFSIKNDKNVAKEEKNEAERIWKELKEVYDPLYKERIEWQRLTNTIPKLKEKEHISKNTWVAAGVSFGCTFGPWVLERFGYIIKRPTEWIPKHLFWKK